MYRQNNFTLTPTRGLKASILQFLAFGIGVYVFYYILVGRYAEVEGKVTLIATVLVILSYILLRNSVSIRSDRRLLQTAVFKQNNITYTDGTKVALYGKIRAQDTTVISPITKTPCVFYKYGIYQWVWRNTGKGSKKEKDYLYAGHLLAPSSIDIGYKRINILSVPETKNFIEAKFKFDISTQAYYTNAANYIQATQFTKLATSGIPQIKQVIASAKDRMFDQDGSNRSDMEFKQIHDFESVELEEEIVQEGEDVCVIGVWNNEKLGLIADYGIATLIIFKGLPDSIIKAFEKQIAGLLFIGIALFISANVYIGYYAVKMYNLETPLRNLLQSFLNLY